MTHPLLATADALADLLAGENVALAAMEHGAAAALVGAKQEATEAFAAAHARFAAAGAPMDDALRRVLAEAADRLATQARRNRQLLERSIAVQGAVIGVIARALPRAAAAPRYGANGALVGARHAMPVALSASI